MSLINETVVLPLGVLQKISNLAIEVHTTTSHWEKMQNMHLFLYGNDAYVVIIRSIFSAQNFLQHYPLSHL